MDDLIRRSEILESLGDRPENWMDSEEEIQACADWDAFHGIVTRLPAVDAVEVVRCRECGHYKPSKYNASTAHYCGVIDGFPKEDWFCADGLRREDGDNGKHL